VIGFGIALKYEFGVKWLFESRDGISDRSAQKEVGNMVAI